MIISIPVLLNVAACLLLASVFYCFHPRKYDALLIFFVGTFVWLIVSYFISENIWLGTGFWLFAIFSMMHFRENYHTYTMVYIFTAMSLWVLASLSGNDGTALFIAYSILSVLIIFGYEKSVKSVKKVNYVVKKEDYHSLIETVERDLNAKVTRTRVTSVRKDQMHVIVSYKQN